MQQEKIAKDLLSQISGIVKKYDDIAATTGERFNIFNILGMSTLEVRLHSTLLAELLNPKGSHGMKDVFLKLFLKHLYRNDSTQDIKTENAIVKVEKWTGFINREKDIGGSIDLFIQLPNREIIIENKIYAGDQEGQLRRYHNYNGNKKPLIIYLTLDGKEADEYTTKNNKYEDDKIEPISLSYQDDIKHWLEECRKEATNHPLIRETITQYINLVKYLTGQTMNNDMENEIIKIITENGERVKSAFAIERSITDVKHKLLRRFADELVSKVKEKKSGIIGEISENFGKENGGIKFMLPNLNDQYVLFSFLGSYNNCYLEIVNKKNRFEENKKKASIESINYYENSLDEVAKGWGKVENTIKAWNGDWVCRYEKKMDVWMKGNSFWVELAEWNFTSKTEEVAQDIEILLNVIEKKHF